MKRARTEEARQVRREALIKAGLDEFFERGFAASRMDDIASRAGLSKGTIYLYFASKEDVFRAVIHDRIGSVIERFETVAGAAPTFREALHGLKQMAPYVIRETDAPRVMKVLIGDSQNFPSIVETYRKELIGRILGLFERLLRRGHEAGEIEVQDAALSARLVIAPIVLSAIWQALFAHQSDADVDLDALFDMHVRYLLKALTPEANS